MKKFELLEIMKSRGEKKLNPELVDIILSNGTFKFHLPDINKYERTTVGIWTTGDGFEITATASSIAPLDADYLENAKKIIENKVKDKIYELYGFYLFGEL